MPRPPAILDWYTVLIGVLAFTTLITHGANWVALKTEHELNARSRKISTTFAIATAVVTVIATPLTFWVSPWMIEELQPAPGRLRAAAHRHRRDCQYDLL